MVDKMKIEPAMISSTMADHNDYYCKRKKSLSIC